MANASACLPFQHRLNWPTPLAFWWSLGCVSTLC